MELGQCTFFWLQSRGTGRADYMYVFRCAKIFVVLSEDCSFARLLDYLCSMTL